MKSHEEDLVGVKGQITSEHTLDWSWIISEPLRISCLTFVRLFNSFFFFNKKMELLSSVLWGNQITLQSPDRPLSLRWSKPLKKKRSYQLFTRILSLLVKPLPPAGLKAALKLWLQSTSETKINHTFISFLTQRDIPSERDAIYQPARRERSIQYRVYREGTQTKQQKFDTLHLRCSQPKSPSNWWVHCFTTQKNVFIFYFKDSRNVRTQVMILSESQTQITWS